MRTVLLDIFRLQDIVDVVVAVIFLRGCGVYDPVSIDDKLDKEPGSAKNHSKLRYGIKL